MPKGIQKVFSEVPRTYELVNHVLTAGLDIRWRRKAAKLAVRYGGSRWLDMCSGTGETAVYLRRLGDENTRVVAADFTVQMLRQALSKKDSRRIDFVLADARSLPFPDGSFDLVTTSFATRNINTSREALAGIFREFNRVLLPGGRFINLETSQPDKKLVRKAFHFYVKMVVKPVGGLISGSRAGYGYLSRTIPRFYGPAELAGLMRDAGFSRVTFQPMFLGIAAIHEAVK